MMPKPLDRGLTPPLAVPSGIFLSPRRDTGYHPGMAPDQPTPDFPHQSQTPTVPNGWSSARGRPRLPRYDIEAEIGRGGMGIVYRARQHITDRIVAVKVLLEGAAADIDHVGRFHSEARALAGVDHPNVIRIHEVDEIDGVPYFSMEYAPGGSLAQAVAEGRWPPAGEDRGRAAARLLIQVARAVECAHQYGVLHRDLKPANVLLFGTPEEPVPKVSDFGLARRLDDALGQTPTGALLGTPEYMAPEQLESGKVPVGPAADVHGLGALLYETLTGRSPFHSATLAETLRKVGSEEPPPPSGVRPVVDPILEAICLKCLRKRPQQRYASAAALADDLERWERGEPTEAKPPGWGMRLWRGVSRHGWKWAAGLIALTMVGLALGGYFTSEESKLEKVLADARPGEPVTLIGESGPPRWSRWAVRSKGATVSQDSDRPYFLSSSGSALLDLIPHVRHTAYRVRVDVKMDLEGQIGDVGIVVQRREVMTPRGPASVFLELSFPNPSRRDRGPAPPARLLLRAQGEQPGDPVSSSMPLETGRKLDKAPPEGWRTLEIQVTPAAVRAWDGGQAVCEIPADRLEDFFQLLTRQLGLRETPDPVLAPGAALGLYAHNGAASFRNVVFIPESR